MLSSQSQKQDTEDIDMWSDMLNQIANTQISDYKVPEYKKVNKPFTSVIAVNAVESAPVVKKPSVQFKEESSPEIVSQSVSQSEEPKLDEPLFDQVQVNEEDPIELEQDGPLDAIAQLTMRRKQMNKSTSVDPPKPKYNRFSQDKFVSVDVQSNASSEVQPRVDLVKKDGLFRRLSSKFKPKSKEQKPELKRSDSLLSRMWKKQPAKSSPLAQSAGRNERMKRYEDMIKQNQ